MDILSYVELGPPKPWLAFLLKVHQVSGAVCCKDILATWRFKFALAVGPSFPPVKASVGMLH